MWKEATEQVEIGLLQAPSELTYQNSYELKGKNSNAAFRFGVNQSDKIRACDDLKHSRTNEACRVATPIELVTWEHVAELCRMVVDKKRSWGFFKADHASAYKQLPIGPNQAGYAIAAPKSPLDGKRYGFMPNSLMFGSAASVIHYNVFSRILVELVNGISGIHTVGYFDDFGGFAPIELTREALGIFSEFCEILGIELKITKSERGNGSSFRDTGLSPLWSKSRKTPRDINR